MVVDDWLSDPHYQRRIDKARVGRRRSGDRSRACSGCVNSLDVLGHETQSQRSKISATNMKIVEEESQGDETRFRVLTATTVPMTTTTIIKPMMP